MKRRSSKCTFSAFLSCLLAAILLLSSMPMSALGAPEPRVGGEKVNYALGCSYTSTDPYQENGVVLYPDTDHKELTDGDAGKASTEFREPQWVGFAGNPPSAEITIDLGMERSFDTLEYTSFIYSGAAIGLPITEVITYSTDGSVWNSFYEGRGRTTMVTEGTETVTIPGELVTARFVKFSFTYESGTWLFFSEFQVLGDAGENACEIPRFSQNLSSQKSVYVDDMVNFTVSANVSDGGELSYQWYKDDTPIGTNSNTYNISRVALSDAGEYRVVVTNTKDDATAVAVSVRCTLSVTENGETVGPGETDEPPENPDSNNLAQGVTYTPSWRANAAYPDGGNKKLTDTRIAAEASYRDSAWAGFNRGDAPDTNPLAIVVDLGAVKRFMEVSVNMLANPSVGIYSPTGIKVSTSENKTGWTALSEDVLTRPDNNSITTYQYVAEQAKSARYIKIEFITDAAWTFVDEIKVLEYPQSSMPGDQSDNLAFEKSYTSSPEASSTYPDSEHKKLTDGRSGVADFSAGLWAGYGANGGTSEIVLDLEESVTFEQVEMSFLKSRSTGIYCPESVQVMTSNDQSDWKLLFEKTIADPSEELTVYQLRQGLTTAATARYVKVIFSTQYWVFIDEIRVLRDRTDVAEAIPVEEEMDPNVISYGKEYTLTYAPNTSYPDVGDKQLTDGKRGTSSYVSREWVGFHSGGAVDESVDGFQMVVDLGASTSFEQVKVGFLNDSTVGIYAPSGNVNVETSDDLSEWKLFAESGAGYFNKDTNGVQRYIAEGTATARYVRVSVDFTDYWMFMDEVEVLAVKDERIDGDKNPDNGWKNNLVRDYGYELIGAPKQNSNMASTALTDGKYAVTGSKYDTNWLGFSGTHTTITFDLKNPASIYEIIFSSRIHEAYNQVAPQNLKFYTSNDGESYSLLKAFTGDVPYTFVGGRDSFNCSMENPGAVYARYIRIEFDAPSSATVFVDEIEVIGKRGRCSDAVPAAPEKNADGSYNLALGKSYTLDEVEVPNNFPDVGGVQLTDGIFGTVDTNDTAWVGYQRYVHISGDYGKTWPLKSIIVDLGEEKSITSTRLNILGMGANSMYTQPWTIRAFASTDGENWMPLYKNWDLGLGATGIHSYGWRYKDTQGVSQDLTPDTTAPYVARYVRYDIELYCMQLVDEVEVYGYDGIVDGAQQLTNFTQLENGTGWNKSGEHNDYAHDAALVYNGWYGLDDSDQAIGDWKPEWFRPYLTYIDRNGKAVDTMFDTFYFLGLNSRYGPSFYDHTADPAAKKDWDWYLDKTFAVDGDLDALESAAETAAMELNDPNFTAKAILMVPVPLSGQRNFGEIDGENLDFYRGSDGEKAINWYMQEALARFQAKEYEHVSLIGFCYVGESGDGGSYRQAMSDFCDANDLHSFWIPYSASYGQLYYDRYGIENMSLQPNHYFGNYLDDEGNGKTTNYFLSTSSIEKHAKMAAYCGGSIEMECGDGILRNEPGKYNQFLDYLNGTAKLGAQGSDYLTFWYNDVHSIAQYCYSVNNNVRNLYEYIYQWIQGCYTEKPYIDNVDYNLDGYNHARPAYDSAEGLVPAAGTGRIGGTGVAVNMTLSGSDESNSGFSGGSSGGSSSGGSSGGSSSGGSTTPSVPDEKPATTGWSKSDDGKWYYVNENGENATGWLKVNNAWYYLNSDGSMKTGWVKDGNTWYYLQNWGGMANTQWVQVGNTWYYFKGNGAMATGWLQLGNTWYYLKSSGAMATGWNWVGNKCYYFYNSGAMAANTTIGGYKVDASGAWI